VNSLGCCFLTIVACAVLLTGWFEFPSRRVLAQATSGGQTHPAATNANGSVASTNASTGAASTTMSVQVNVVNVFATVRDRKGNLVSDLTKDDFTLNEDGHPQEIRYFAKESDLPLTLGLLVDTSLSQRRVLEQERSASRSFLDQMVGENKDKAFLIHFDREVELLQDLTSSHQKLEDAVSLLETGQSGDSNSQDSSSGQGRGGHHGGTLLYDAVYLAANELMKKQSGRKALIVLSDGVDRGSKESLDSAMESAQRADTMVYSIVFKDDESSSSGGRGGFGFPGIGGPGMGGGMGRRGGGGRGSPPEESRPDGKKVLQQISQKTGGRLFEVSKKLPVDQIYAQIEQELRTQYSLGYTPARAEDYGGGYRKIQLTTTKKDLVVQARDGYYAESKE
jgi:VWFA-related protein